MRGEVKKLEERGKMTKGRTKKNLFFRIYEKEFIFKKRVKRGGKNLFFIQCRNEQSIREG